MNVRLFGFLHVLTHLIGTALWGPVPSLVVETCPVSQLQNWNWSEAQGPDSRAHVSNNVLFCLSSVRMIVEFLRELGT